jgi:hypothetical protein
LIVPLQRGLRLLQLVVLDGGLGRDLFGKSISVLGSLKAQEAGYDMVLPRSAFSQSRAQILKRYAG